MTEKEVVDSLLEIRDALHNRLGGGGVTPLQELRLAVQIQHNLFLHQVNFSKSGQVPGQFDQPNGDVAGVLVDMYTQLENVVDVMERKASD